MIATAWTYLVADLLTGTIATELPLSAVSMTKPINDAGTLQASLQLGKYKIEDPYRVTAPARTAIYALRDGVPFWGGIIWTSRYDSVSKIVQIGASDWWSYFDHRKVVQLLDTIDGPSAVASTTTNLVADQNQIARDLIALAQTHTHGDIGIQFDASTSGVLQNLTYAGYSLTSVGDALRDLTKLTGGPDIRFDVGNPTDGSNRPARLMLVGNPTLAQDGDPLVLEYGGNLISYAWSQDGSAMATRGYAIGSGTEESTPISISEPSAGYDDGWPLLEEETSHDTIDDPTLLTNYAVADQAAVRVPVAVASFAVNSQMEPMLGQYAPGWLVRALIKDEYFINGLDAVMRIVSLAVSPADGGIDQVTLSMNPILEDEV